jgi:signal transduction histidine kinase
MIKLSKQRGATDASQVHQPERRMLIVDDEPALLNILSKLFSEFYDVRVASSGEAALELIDDFQPEVIIADQRMPGMSGAEFLAQTSRMLPKTVRIVLTGYTDLHDIVESINIGHVYLFLTKPWETQELLDAVKTAFDYYDVVTQNAELKRAIVRYETANGELQELHAEKDELMNIVAHDLKNPIHQIIGLAQMMKDPSFDLAQEQYHEFSRQIHASAERMYDMVDSLLNMRAIENGAIKATIIPLSLAAVAKSALSDYRQRAEAKSIALHYNSLLGDDKAMVQADESFVYQVVDNLVSNAIKYSPNGSAVHLLLSQDEPAYYRLEVRDEGPGLTHDDQKHLFSKFARLSARPTGGESSTGLGLSIAKRMMDLMHGKLWCESTAGQGATFIMELPAA